MKAKNQKGMLVAESKEINKTIQVFQTSAKRFAVYLNNQIEGVYDDVDKATQLKNFLKSSI